VESAREAVLRTFRWIDGHADVWAVFRDAAALRAVVAGLAAPCRVLGVTAVAGIESRGFLLGGAVAVELGVGFVPLRKAGSLFPGPTLGTRTELDYRGISGELLVQRAALAGGDRVVLVDDWIETGSQAVAARHLVEACGASLVGISVVVDDLGGRGVRRSLPSVTSLVTPAELGPQT